MFEDFLLKLAKRIQLIYFNLNIRKSDKLDKIEILHWIFWLRGHQMDGKIAGIIGAMGATVECDRLKKGGAFKKYKQFIIFYK